MATSVHASQRKDTRLDLATHLSPELLRLLHLLYPSPAVNPSRTIEDLMYAGGQRSVVDHLQDCYDYLQREASHARLSQSKQQVSVQVDP